jgi:Amt family ammonium transporter
VGGITGMILTGVLVQDKGLFYGETHTFLVHLVALVGISVFCLLLSYVLYVITNAIAPLRVEKEHELMGLDLSQHAETIFST